jgi:hypothetical protein
MTKQQIINGSQPYFKQDKQLEMLYATNDGAFFYNKGDARYHATQHTLELSLITRDMAEALQDEAQGPAEPVEVDQVKAKSSQGKPKSTK